VSNDPPYFDSALSTTIEVNKLELREYVMPTAFDDEGLSITYNTFEKSQSVLPSFITFDLSSLKYSMSPVKSDKAGKYTI